MEINNKIKTRLAQIAYIQDKADMVSKIKGIYPMAGVVPIFVERTDTEAFLLLVDGVLIFGASGTESKRDLLVDLKCHLGKYSFGDGRLHVGFNGVIESIAGPLSAAMWDLCGNSDPEKIVCLGHSLGAEIAMGALDILSQLCSCKKTQLTTWGCPNGWGKEAREGFQARHKNVLHIQNRFDIVTMLQGVTTGRPWDGHQEKFLKLKGKWGHSLSKYAINLW